MIFWNLAGSCGIKAGARLTGLCGIQQSLDLSAFLL